MGVLDETVYFDEEGNEIEEPIPEEANEEVEEA